MLLDVWCLLPSVEEEGREGGWCPPHSLRISKTKTHKIDKNTPPPPGCGKWRNLAQQRRQREGVVRGADMCAGVLLLESELGLQPRLASAFAASARVHPRYCSVADAAHIRDSPFPAPAG